MRSIVMCPYMSMELVLMMIESVLVGIAADELLAGLKKSKSANVDVDAVVVAVVVVKLVGLPLLNLLVRRVFRR